MSAANVVTVISNLALLLPSYTAWRFGRIFRTFIYFTEAFVSALYHLCDFSGICIFSFSILHASDFFFAQLLIVDCGLYLIDFKKRYRWIEWFMFFIGMIAIYILLVTIGSGELFVQAAIVGAMLIIVVVYWFIWKVPAYDWYFFTLGLSLIGGSITLFSFQTVWPDGYWAVHSLWHIMGSIGRHYLFYIKPAVSLIENAAARIQTPLRLKHQLLPARPIRQTLQNWRNWRF